MKSTFPPFFHFKEFSADQFSKSTALIVKYVFTTYIMIKRYSKHLCTMYIPSLHFHHYFLAKNNQLMNSFNQLMNSFNLEITFYIMKTSQVKQHFAKIYASDARSCL